MTENYGTESSIYCETKLDRQGGRFGGFSSWDEYTNICVPLCVHELSYSYRREEGTTPG